MTLEVEKRQKAADDKMIVVLEGRVPSTGVPLRTGLGRWRRLVLLGASVAIISITRMSSDAYLLSRLAGMMVSNELESQKALKAPLTAADRLCTPCKLAAVGKSFTCTARIDRYLVDGTVSIETAQKTVSKEYEECSVCDPDKCSTHEGEVNAIEDFAQASQMQENSLNRTALFVHIGKSGGETIKNILEAGCRSRMNRKTRADCLQKVPQSRLSRVVQGYTHCFQWHPSAHFADVASTFLFNLRHPLDRAVSWYHFVHPDLCDKAKDARSIKCKVARELSVDPGLWAGKFFRQCFPSILDWVNTATSADVSREVSCAPNCTQLALDTLQGSLDFNKQNSAAAHMIANLRANVKRTIGRDPRKEILVVRTHHLWEDLRYLNVWLGGRNDSFGDMVGSAYNARASGIDELVFPDEVTRKFCCVLSDEMLTYSDLIQRAVNLNQTSKDDELVYLANRCGSPSWSDWTEVCGVSTF